MKDFKTKDRTRLRGASRLDRVSAAHFLIFFYFSQQSDLEIAKTVEPANFESPPSKAAALATAKQPRSESPISNFQS